MQPPSSSPKGESLGVEILLVVALKGQNINSPGQRPGEKR